MSSTATHSNVNKSKFSLFTRQLYKFFFRSRKPEIITYGISLLVALIYAFINDFVLKRPRETVMLEGSIIAAVTLISIILVYNLRAIRKKKDFSAITAHWDETKDWFNSRRSPDLAVMYKEILGLVRLQTEVLKGVSSVLVSLQEQSKETSSSLDALVQEFKHSPRWFSDTLSQTISEVVQHQADVIARSTESLTQGMPDSFRALLSELRTLNGQIGTLTQSRQNLSAFNQLMELRNRSVHLLQPKQQPLEDSKRTMIALYSRSRAEDLGSTQGLSINFESLKSREYVPVILYDQNGAIVRIILVGEHGVSIYDRNTKVGILAARVRED